MGDTQITKKYKCVFFDLDHTLWDYEKNAEETLAELYTAFSLSARGVPDALSLYLKFREVNLALWDLYDTNRCDQQYIRTERFKQILTHFAAYDSDLSEKLSIEYLSNCPKKNNMMPYAIEMLEYLHSKYQLTVVTNGFDEIQNMKLSSGNLHRFFHHIVTSQKAGHRKPSGRIFEYAMKANNVRSADVVMIGDNLVTDIGGAKAAEIDAIFFNRDKINHSSPVNHEISCLSELKNIL
ncbi:MAG TPA: YjjG family noncanonical pyrimidine nucleotidase [Chryseosolibacter sp.]|nr:YjjG family noncanonical pyrimidine nucleotidase [Chryseosolibacter sp.]